MPHVLQRWVCGAACVALVLPPCAAEVQPSPPLHAYTTVAGDTLIGIGRRLLVQPAAWPQIARASGLRNANRIPVGLVLGIPLALMRSEPAPATVVAVVGEARLILARVSDSDRTGAFVRQRFW